jgi:hypothetical protein
MSQMPLRVLMAALLASTLSTGLSAARLAEAQTLGKPVAFNLCAPEGAAAIEKCDVIGHPAAYDVPSGRTLIIEQVSGDCGSDAAPGLPLRMAVVAQTGGVVVEHAIIGIPNASLPGGQIPLTRTRIYADPKTSVTIGLTEIPGSTGRFCRVAFSGQLVK